MAAFHERALRRIQAAPIARLGEDLGLAPGSLERLDVGFVSGADLAAMGVRGGDTAFSFPMRTATGELCGIRLRLQGGRKLSARGSRTGLFLPRGAHLPLTLWVTEGPTDCATLLELGLQAVGRPSCTGGVSMLVELVRRWGHPSVVILSDSDSPGRAGAASLARCLAPHTRDVRTIEPPEGIKDAREWKREGATAVTLVRAAEAALPTTLQIIRSTERLR